MRIKRVSMIFPGDDCHLNSKTCCDIKHHGRFPWVDGQASPSTQQRRTGCRYNSLRKRLCTERAPTVPLITIEIFVAIKACLNLNMSALYAGLKQSLTYEKKTAFLGLKLHSYLISVILSAAKDLSFCSVLEEIFE